MHYLVTKREGKGEQYRVWSRIEVETVIIIPDNWLNTQRERTQMALMCYSRNELQKIIYTILSSAFVTKATSKSHLTS